MTRRIHTGNLIRVVSRRSDEVELESALRLRPGQRVELVLDDAGASEVQPRAALIMSWCVARLGKDGPIYRGRCRWQR